MLRLLKIDLLKLVNYRTFWVLSIMYSVLLITIPTSVMEFLKWLKVKGADFDGFDPLKIPVLYFPDIWQNITYVYVFLKIFLAILVIISVSNEYSYKTVRQNIIDGMSRMDFVKSKLYTITLLCLTSTAIVFLTGLLTGLIYTPNLETSDIFQGIEFVAVYFLDILAYSIFAFLMTILIKRSGLTIALMVLVMPIEYTITSNLPEFLSFTTQYFPLHAINNLIEVPFPKYVFMEIQDYVSLESVFVVMAYIVLFIYAIYAKLRKSDL
jgi:hypothetical protein